MNDTTPRYIKIGDAISQLFNVLLFPRHKYTNANESISGRCHRCGWKCAEKVINALCYVFEKDHCRKSYIADVSRARSLIEEYERSN